MEISRTDSPDPVMYDLMRKSIQATTTAEANHYKVARRKIPGQNHLLYRNCKAENVGTPLTAAGAIADPSSVTPFFDASEMDSGQWLPSDTPIVCPTRLLIRRRSLRVVEEGGGTHIYAIRYPEDTPDRVISEQATPRSESARQEQCPPKNAMADGTNIKFPFDMTVATATTTSKTKVILSPALIEGTDFFLPAAMSSKPRQPGKFLLLLQTMKRSTLG